MSRAGRLWMDFLSPSVWQRGDRILLLSAKASSLDTSVLPSGEFHHTSCNS